MFLNVINHPSFKKDFEYHFSKNYKINKYNYFLIYGFDIYFLYFNAFFLKKQIIVITFIYEVYWFFGENLIKFNLKCLYVLLIHTYYSEIIF